jgi:hypothetical protein
MLTKTITELYNIFNFLNKEFFNSECPTPMLTIQKSGSKKTILGWCSGYKIWHDKEKKDYYEVNICADSLNRTVLKIEETMLHELVHLYCGSKDIKDTSNNCVYHNKNYKKEAEARGLNVDHAPTIGHAVTSLKESTVKLLENLKVDETAFSFYRDKVCKGGTTKKQKSYKYVCPNCGKKFTLYKDIDVVCKDCNKDFEKFEKNGE